MIDLGAVRGWNSRKTVNGQNPGFSELLHWVYATIDKPNEWPMLLEAISESVGASSASIYHTHQTGQRGRPIHDGAGNLFNIGSEPLCLLNPNTVRSKQPAERLQVVGGLLCPYENLIRTSFYQLLNSSTDTSYSIHITLVGDDDFQAHMALFRTSQQGAFKGEQAELIDALQPHLQRALELRRRITGLESSAGSTELALDKMPQAAILLDESERVLFANLNARRIIDQNDGIDLHGARLRLFSNTENELFHSLANEAISKNGKNGAMKVSRRSQSRPYILMVAPFRSRVGSPERARNIAAIVFINDPEANMPPGIEILGRLYGLTAAECRIAQALAMGASVEEVAVSSDISTATVRTHLKRIFMKTNTRRQSELVRVLLSSVFELGKQKQ